jgi:hypothetical protein
MGGAVKAPLVAKWACHVALFALCSQNPQENSSSVHKLLLALVRFMGLKWLLFPISPLPLNDKTRN